ncbi:motility associated factor glycosyltransferase family protein [Romboutsia lituseburensis]|uniref:motility associated factor glycosyltransferase family protein n=1 Tax=Romboutsia lituseburensis TaxID=1537 RepID=UPI00215B2539|nr:6-hydroxymethylpterin diphosphokinase MptE-like protein [Romboutsia lituseburensis]MCR8744760.1 DUF115 domain-containing protein [Romboutsia lituseburensis]
MSNIRKLKSDDDYYLYELKKDDKLYYLGNRKSYKNNIENLVNSLEGLLFDSIVFIFGLDSSEYIKALKNNICTYNKVIIIEPNEDIFNIYKDEIFDENMSLVLYEQEVIQGILNFLINFKNFNRLYVHCFGNYEEAYKEEYEKFIEMIDYRYYVAVSSLALDNRFKKMFFENMISNLYQINNSSPLNSYINYNKNIPAIIVSAGPSLDKNIETMIKYKNNLDKFFIIAGNRTLGTLMKNGITPNLVVSIDPNKVTYEMMEEYLNSAVPFAFYEYSNKNLVEEYRGDKIYLSQLFSKTIEDFTNLSGTYSGGSVAHTCIDIALLMGCNPIILVGQDCALTYGNHHSKNATFDIDSKVSYKGDIIRKDVYGNEIKTSKTLDFFRIKIEEYIILKKDENENIKFINASYGVDINGAPHKELKDLLLSSDFSENAKYLIQGKSLNINAVDVINSIHEYINYFIEKCVECEKICKKILNKNIKASLLNIDDDDENLKDFLYVMKTVDEFEFSKMSNYLGCYLNKFLFDVRQKYFEMESKNYEKLSSNFNYQSETFINYFKELKIMLEEVKDILLNTHKM